ncbi:MAG: TM0106 family RecB-like putative nuclease, partial [Acidimicrobiia bacterium]
GVDVIYQATFFDGRWRGHADFLLRVDTPSPALGPWSYEVADTKLARRVKAAALLQMCAYSEQVERLQGLAPARMHVITGDGEQHPFTVTDYSAYYRTLKARFEELVLGPGTPNIYPDPVDHCGICRWADGCKDRRRADDHLSLVSGMRRDQTRKLSVAGIPTRRDLAVMPGDADAGVAGIGEATLERLRHQAELQVKGEGHEPPLYEVLRPERPDPADPSGAWPERGWALLPKPSPGDLYFDMEGDPFALEGGLEYLFGVSWVTSSGEPGYRAFWAHTRDEEHDAFAEFVDFVEERRREHPDLHVYHYAPYEPTAVKRLMGEHHTREAEVDTWLRAGVFVDLYAVVRAGVRIGIESYSLKQVEHLYLERAQGDVMDAGASIVAYEEFLERKDPSLLDGIEAYNAEDCRSTLELHRWLEARRAEADAEWGPIPRAEPDDGKAPENVAERAARVAELAEQLTAGVPEAREDRNDEQQARWLLAQMLDWHRREAKPDYWMYFARQHMSDDQLFEDRESISGLRYVGDVGQEKQSTVQRYEFAPQDHKFTKGKEVHDPVTGKRTGEVFEIDDVAGWIDLVRGPSLVAAHPGALVPRPPVPTAVLEDAIERIADHVLSHGIDAPGRYRAALDLLLRKRRAPDAGPFDESYLAIQGPPGSGKTTKGAELIVERVGEGKRVGITAHSHAVIGNLLAAVEELDPSVRALQKAEDHQASDASIVTCTESNDVVEGAARSREYNVIAGTAWLWARPGMTNSVDVLFVDEAGQKSLADVLAVSGATTQLVLLGDPQQLAQPSKGSHPDGAEVSALEHVLGDEPTMPDDLGWFLESTHRMHPAVCEFVS